MLCFKDRTFCGSDCKKSDCYRFFGVDQQKEADKWWGKEGAPIAFSDFSTACEDYTNA